MIFGDVIALVADQSVVSLIAIDLVRARIGGIAVIAGHQVDRVVAVGAEQDIVAGVPTVTVDRSSV